MPFPRIPIQSKTYFPWALSLVGIYSFALRPSLFHLLPALRPMVLWVLSAFVVLGFAGLFICKKRIGLEKALDRSHLGPHILLGLTAGGLVTLFPLFIDWLIGVTPLAQEPLFIGAETRALEQPPLSLLVFLETLVLRPILGQIILLGFCLQPIAGRLSQMSFILLTACFFPVFFWQFSLGLALLGAASAWMFCFTGTLYAGIGFQALCGLGGVLLVYVVPRTLTFFGVLL